jgi:competence ComEA-like helix-hairpin-helix protein
MDGMVGPSSPPAARESVDVNTATADLLRKSVPKVGAVLAQRIVEFRAQNGPFKSIDELMNVPGIGRRLAESLIPPPPDESQVMNLRHATLPPPWGTPIVSGSPESPTPQSDEKEPPADEKEPPADSGRLSISVSTAPSPRPKTGAFKVAALAVAVVAGLCIGIWANTQSVKRPTRELSERIEVTRTETEHARSDLDQQRGELQKTQDEVKALEARVDAEAAERKADQAKVAHDVSTLHDAVKKTTQSNEARIQRLRETLTEIELYHGANIAHPH